MWFNDIYWFLQMWSADTYKAKTAAKWYIQIYAPASYKFDRAEDYQIWTGET